MVLFVCQFQCELLLLSLITVLCTCICVHYLLQLAVMFFMQPLAQMHFVQAIMYNTLCSTLTECNSDQLALSAIAITTLG